MNINRRDFIKSLGTVSLGVLALPKMFGSHIASAFDSPEEITNKVTVGRKIDSMSCPGLSEYNPIFINGKQKGALVSYVDKKPGRTSKTKFISAHAYPKLFIKGSNRYQRYPNYDKIIPYIQSLDNKHNQILGAHVSAMFDSIGNVNGFVANNNMLVGNETTIKGRRTSGRGMVMISPEGKMSMNHTMNLDDGIMHIMYGSGRDFFPAPSAYRRSATGYPINESTMGVYKHIHFLCSFADGSSGLLVLNNVSKQEIIAVVKKYAYAPVPRMQMMVYNDADRQDDTLHQILTYTEQGLKMSHPDYGDLFTNPKAISRAKPPHIFLPDMQPSILVHYAQED